ncbi:MAG: hypothetical protein JSW34_08125 [Candidatus Zixiibacteriota bacterium]|nr:MAG: hypothetical protein JSW34_08125 [candidate division Zixibacteria bacterium]
MVKVVGVKLSVALLVTCLIYSAPTARDCIENTVVLSKQLDLVAAGEYYEAAQNVGNWVLGISANCHLGTGPTHDYFTGDTLENGDEFPKYSMLRNFNDITYWVGGIVNGDTLVSAGWFYDVETAGGSEWTAVSGKPLRARSVLDPSLAGYEDAVSELDLVGACTDTTVVSGIYYPDYFYGWPPRPLGIEIDQRSYAWSNHVAENIVFIDLTIRNIGEETIERVYFGIRSRPMVGFTAEYG